MRQQMTLAQVMKQFEAQGDDEARQSASRRFGGRVASSRGSSRGEVVALSVR